MLKLNFRGYKSNVLTLHALYTSYLNQVYPLHLKRFVIVLTPIMWSPTGNGFKIITDSSNAPLVPEPAVNSIIGRVNDAPKLLHYLKVFRNKYEI